LLDKHLSASEDVVVSDSEKADEEVQEKSILEEAIEQLKDE
jgi:hypothetical protein